MAARRSPLREVSPPRPTVLNFEQCIDSKRAREDTPDIFPVDELASDVWLELGLIEMPEARGAGSQHTAATRVLPLSLSCSFF